MPIRRTLVKPALAPGRVDQLRRLRGRVARHPVRTLVVVAAIPRLLVALAGAANDAVLLSDDGLEYLALANDLGSYADEGGELWRVALLRPPGYPILLSLPQAASDSVWVAGLFQAAMSVLVVWLTWVLGRELLGRRGGFVAALWVALDPTTIVQMGRLLSEAPYSALVLVAALFAYRAMRRASPNLAALSGAALAAATFMRPVSLYLPLLIPLVVLAAARGRTPLRDGVKIGAAMLVAFAIPVGGWIMHVRADTGVPLFSTIEGVNMLDYRAAGAVASDEHTSLVVQISRLRAELGRRTDPRDNPAEIAQAARALGLETLREHPRGYLRSTTTGLGRLLLGPSRSQIVEVTEDVPGGALLERSLTGISLASAIALLLAAAVGAAVLARRRDVLILVVTALPVAYHLLVGSGADSDSRFRAPLVPLLAILAASWLMEVRGRQLRPSQEGSRDEDGILSG